jgi:hypothetical protein
MSSRVWRLIVVVQLGVICVLAVLLFEARRPKTVPSRVETVLADIHGVLSVGANYTQFQEKVQSLGGAIEEYRSEGGDGPTLKRFEECLKLYKDSLDLWGDTINLPNTYSRSGTRVPATLERIAKEQGFDIDGPYQFKIQSDVLMQQLWAKADEVGRGNKSRAKSSGH